YNQSAMILYFNGQPVATNAIGAKVINASSSNLRIGNEDNGNTPFDGQIDEPAVYNRALSAAEIQAIYSAAYVGKCGLPPTVTTQPQGQTVLMGSSVVFAASVAG